MTKLILFIILFSLGKLSYGQEFEFNKLNIDWTALEKGIYNVGYKSSWTKDYSRVVIFEGDTINRPILVNIWYPAKNKTDVESMSYINYFDIESSNDELEVISEKYKSYNLSILYEELIGKSKKDFTETEKIVFDQFLQHKISIQINAEPEKGKFPLVIYHQGYGASFDDNSILAQFLASNGYVVIGSSFFNENIKSLGVNGRDQSAKDIAYLINYASKLENVDLLNISLIGHSGGAQASFIAKSNTLNYIKAVVGIETTQETYGLSDPRWDNFINPVIKNLSNMNGSILAFTDHKAVFQLYDMISQTDRHYITFPETLNHNEYISQGIFASYLKNQILEQSRSEQSNLLALAEKDLSNYIKVNNYILKFFQWKLKNKESKSTVFEKSESNLSTNFDLPVIDNVPLGAVSVESYSFNPQIPLKPRQVWEMAHSNKTDSLLYSLNYFIKINRKLPVYHDIFAFSLISELIERNNLKSAKKLFAFYKLQKIPITERFLSLSEFTLSLGLKDYTKRCLTHLLILEPDNIEAKKLLEKT